MRLASFRDDMGKPREAEIEDQRPSGPFNGKRPGIPGISALTVPGTS